MSGLPYIGTALGNLFRKPNTMKFPVGDAPAAQPGYRGKIAYDPNKCINCGMCIRVCAPQAITREIKNLENGDQEITFTFDMTSCTFCGTCADFCTQQKTRCAEVHSRADRGDEGGGGSQEEGSCCGRRRGPCGEAGSTRCGGSREAGSTRSGEEGGRAGSRKGGQGCRLMKPSRSQRMRFFPLYSR